LVEDSPGDIRLTLEAFNEENPSAEIFVVKGGVEAMAFLTSGSNRPDLVLLDLNMPKMDGRDSHFAAPNNNVVIGVTTDKSARALNASVARDPEWTSLNRRALISMVARYGNSSESSQNSFMSFTRVSNAVH